MPLDLAPDLIAALLDPRVRAALREACGTGQEVRAAFQEQTDPLLPIRGAAEHVGLSYGAFKQRLATDATLQDIRRGTARLSRFRRSDLDRWQAAALPGKRRGPAPR